MSKASWIYGNSETALPVLPPRGAVVELAAIVLAIVAIDWLLPAHGLTEVGPSPYWLPVLLMSLQYGTVSGLLAAGVGIAMTMLPGVPEQGVGENHFAYLLRIWAQPILWIAVAVLLGQFRIRQIAVKRELIQQVEELSTQRQSLADYANNLRQRCETIERSIAGGDELTGLGLLADARLLSDPSHDLDAALGRVMGRLAPGSRASVYIVDSDRLLKLATSAGDTAPLLLAEFDPAHPIYRAVIGRGESVSALDPACDAVLSGLGVAAVPIRSVGDGGVIGLLKLDRAPAAAIAPTTLGAMEGLAALIAQRLVARPETHADLRPAFAPAAVGAVTVRSFFRKPSTWLRGGSLSPDRAAETRHDVRADDRPAAMKETAG